MQWFYMPYPAQIERLRFQKKILLQLRKNELEAGHQAWGQTTSSLNEIERAIGFKIRKFIAHRLRKSKTPLDILDVGMANSPALNSLKKHFGDRITTSGMSILAKPSIMPDKFHTGDFRQLDPKLKYDLIFSRLGPFSHSRELSGYYGKAVRALKPGGIFISKLFNHRYEGYKPVLDYLRRVHGITYSYNEASSRLIIRKPKEKAPLKQPKKA